MRPKKYIIAKGEINKNKTKRSLTPEKVSVSGDKEKKF